MAKDKAQPRKLYNLIIATNRILLIGKSFFRHQTIEQLRSHQNPNAYILSIIEIGMPMGFEAVAYTRSTILEDCIQDNSGGFSNPPIEKEPGTTIAPSTNQEQCPCSPLALQTAPTAKTTAASRSAMNAPAICRDS
ncbi:unnamed protein product [Tuber aestivum]|uniref:Uncharacterized protein n=1 Tax=Tuber aestivum TaxID=59557 RepID=A0A292PXR5_9PEZI|nr:unnamed protein product [Tuber aestivum]